jgi:hypothetical protein
MTLQTIDVVAGEVAWVALALVLMNRRWPVSLWRLVPVAWVLAAAMIAVRFAVEVQTRDPPLSIWELLIGREGFRIQVWGSAVIAWVLAGLIVVPGGRDRGIGQGAALVLCPDVITAGMLRQATVRTVVALVAGLGVDLTGSRWRGFPRQTIMAVDRRQIRAIRVCFGLGLITTVLLAWLGAAASELGVLRPTAVTGGGDQRQALPGSVGAVTLQRWDSPLSTLVVSGLWPSGSEAAREAIRDERGFALPGWAERTVAPWRCGRAGWPDFKFVPAASESGVIAAEVRGSGWPWAALWTGSLLRSRQTTWPYEMDRVGGVRVPGLTSTSMGFPRPVYVPWRPVWYGFALDAGLWTLAWWLAVSGPRTARRGLRRWRNQCAECAYSLRGNTSGVCPECGSPAIDGLAAPGEGAS